MRAEMAKLYRQQAALFVRMAKLLEEGVPDQAPAPVKRKTSLKVETLPDSWRAYCEDKRPDLEPESVFTNFADFYLSHGRTMLNWDRTWQRWVRNERTQARKNGTMGVPRDAAELHAFVAANGLPQARPGESLYEWRSRVMVAAGIKQ
jgi:anti-sigma factor RsiW